MGKPHLTAEQRGLALRLQAKGLNFREIGEEIDASVQTAWNAIMKAPTRTVRPFTWSPGPGRLTLAEREEISLGLRRGSTLTAIAAQLGRSLSTVSREVSANGGRDEYRAWRAHERAYQRSLRPKPRKLASRQLAAEVTRWLRKWWSPQEISKRLRLEHPDDPMMWVSHETIYKTLFIQGRGELRRELTNIIGKNGDSQVGTLVERSTRYVMLLHLPDGRFPVQVDAAMRRAIRRLPKELFQTITWDQGKEMHRHAEFTVDTGVQIYFCDPRSPWQRGSNENTNGLLRQYMPKGTDLSTLSARDLSHFARSLNDRPRATLGFMKPSEKLAELLADTG